MDIMQKITETFSRERIVVASGILGFGATTLFAWILHSENIPHSLASWLMVMMLEIIGLFSVLKGGNKKPYLQLGWTVAALCVLLALLIGDSPWHWGRTETISLLSCLVVTVLLLKAGARVAVWAYMVAMYVAFIPLMVDYWHTPQPATLWFWLLNITACLLAVYGAQKRDFASTFIPWASIFQNALIALLCIL